MISPRQHLDLDMTLARFVGEQQEVPVDDARRHLRKTYPAIASEITNGVVADLLDALGFRTDADCTGFVPSSAIFCKVPPRSLRGQA